ncbi:MAG: DUF3737 family protein [Lentisphaeria bacterium]|nr:MAG: DUF3737 family protein [Lentisphaeria bacterium]
MGASGNVIRNGRFYHSDAQWHAGWSTENLFENCTIISDTREFGGYGNIFWASSPEDGGHGPNGPRNVVYNCDGSSIADGVFLGGMNENWIFAWNRLRVKKRGGLLPQDIQFRSYSPRKHGDSGGSAFPPSSSSPPPDCGGVELIGNTFSGGNGKLYSGLHKPFLEKGNRIIPLNTALPRPQPAVPSIYEWQLKHKR